MEILSLNSALLIMASVGTALAFSPFLYGLINRVKSFIAGRNGPPLLQMYYDLFRLFRKDSVYSTTSTWVFRLFPPCIFALTLAATSLVPLFPDVGIHLFGMEAVLLFFLLAGARFLLILSALDTGSAFEGMGASREAFFSALAEPVIFASLLALAKSAGSVDLETILGSGNQPFFIVVALTSVSMFLVLLAENARIPFDDPTTHLELTMIHEVMVLDHSGRGLALVEYASAIKLWIFSALLARILISPFAVSPVIGLAGIVTLIVLISLCVGVVESSMARLQLTKVPLILVAAAASALLAFVFSTFTLEG